MTEQQQTGITIQLFGRVIEVRYTDSLSDIADEYELSESMVKHLAELYGGYPIANEKSMKALARRDIVLHLAGVGYVLSELGQDLCEDAFVKTEL